MDSKICFEMSVFVVEAMRTLKLLVLVYALLSMCEFHDCNCNGLGDIWWTDKCMYFSSIDYKTNSLG